MTIIIKRGDGFWFWRAMDKRQAFGWSPSLRKAPGAAIDSYAEMFPPPRIANPSAFD